METPDMTRMVTTLNRAPGIADPGRESGAGRQTSRSGGAQRARRRTFTGQYKLEVLAAYDAAAEGEKSALLRREACIPATSWSGAGLGMRARWPGWRYRGAGHGGCAR